MTEPKAAEAEAEELASKARGRAADGRYEEAERYHRLAIDLCTSIYEETRSDRAAHRHAAQVLADQCGRLGGTLRRSGDLPAALDAYRRGAQLERDWSLDATYNRTNAIVIQVIVDPRGTSALDDDLGAVLELLEAQVEGPRRRELWAWADLGLLSLVGGRDRAAMRAYGNLVELGPEPVFVDSVLAVLRQVRDQVVAVSPGRAAAFDTAVRQVESAAS